MGTWGVGIFSDDEACDIRDEFRRLIADDVEPDQAAKRLAKDHLSISSLKAERAVFWMALAATAWRCGRLTEDVKKRALDYIEKGADLYLWQEEAPKQVKKREATIQKLRDQLLTPQRKPTRIRKFTYVDLGWNAGDAIAFRLLSGRTIIWRVLGIDVKHDVRSPILDIVKSRHRKVPPNSVIESAPRIRTKHFERSLRTSADEEQHVLDWIRLTDGRFSVSAERESQIPYDRWERVATGLKFEDADTIGAWCLAWNEIDQDLERTFRLR